MLELLHPELKCLYLEIGDMLNMLKVPSILPQLIKVLFLRTQIKPQVSIQYSWVLMLWETGRYQSCKPKFIAQHNYKG